MDAIDTACKDKEYLRLKLYPSTHEQSNNETWETTEIVRRLQSFHQDRWGLTSSSLGQKLCKFIQILTMKLLVPEGIEVAE